jgi:hypothetical protein
MSLFFKVTRVQPRMTRETYPVVTLADFLNCSKLDVLAFLSRLFEAVDSASDPESRSEKENVSNLHKKLQNVKLIHGTNAK